jgi:protein SCO1/2
MKRLSLGARKPSIAGRPKDASAAGGGIGVRGGRRPAAGLASCLGVLFFALVATVGSAAPAAPARTVLADPPRPVRDFTLTTTEGKPLKLSELGGAPLLVFFGFSHCPDVCPTTLAQLRRLELNHAKDLGDTHIVVISDDGERDSPARLAEWLTPISPTFIGLTGPEKDVHNIAAQFTAAFFKGETKPDGDYLVQHNSQVFLLDGAGRLRATFYDAPVETMAEVVRSLLPGS